MTSSRHTPAFGHPSREGISANSPAPKSSRLWLWVLAAFAVQFAAWTVWFVIAAHHPVADVPLAPTR